jgi:hypothetical protein
MEEFEFYLIGLGEEGLTSYKETRMQVDAVKTLECALEVEGARLTWSFFDDPGEPRALFQSIMRDRRMRVDKGIPPEYRPPFCVVTAIGDRAVRLEHYEGRYHLKLRYDIRAKELEGANLPNFMEHDPQFKKPPGS